mmetsp:Transcript_24636/g.33775  ORF Transcript_24636/g.33775 Transcript_24636/m.33775 type:complete len:169 (-) Transcript_24636:638-1144(-)
MDNKNASKKQKHHDIKVLRREMPELLLSQAIQKALVALSQKEVTGTDIATSVKTALDRDGGTWHCVVGTQFSCLVTHEQTRLGYFKIDENYVLIFCTDDIKDEARDQSNTILDDLGIHGFKEGNFHRPDFATDFSARRNDTEPTHLRISSGCMNQSDMKISGHQSQKN